MKFDTRVVTKWMKRLVLPVLVLGLVVFFRIYWFVVVPTSMDTMPEMYPPGTICVIERHPDTVREGNVIFLEVKAGAAPILVQVGKVAAGRVFPVVRNRSSRFAGYAQDSYPLTDVRGLVLSGIAPDQPISSPPSNR